jgi:hypothetical protein
MGVAQEILLHLSLLDIYGRGPENGFDQCGHGCRKNSSSSDIKKTASLNFFYFEITWAVFGNPVLATTS